MSTGTTPHRPSVLQIGFLLMGICFISASMAQAQIRINEILASNASVNYDPADSAYSDWVEIHNAGTEAVDLKGYYLTDNFSKPTKWQFPSSTVLPAGGYLIVWCDDGTGNLHTNFKLSADGEMVGLYTPDKEMVDTVSFGPQFVDISYGRLPDDPATFRYFMKPTPAAANTTTPYTGYANQPEILTLGGFFAAPLQVEITQDLGGSVYYTTDGSEPTATSAVYNGPLTISNTTVLRARIIQDGMMPGKVVTETYFIGEAFERHNLAVVSIATDSGNFWDTKKGIYTQSFKPDWEVPVNIEIFENNGADRAAVNEVAGIKINGLYSWQLPQKMLGVYFRKQYGEGKLSYRLFHDLDVSTFDNFALRASGNDWSNTLFRDGLLQQACRLGNANLELMDFRPSVVYVDGQFLGIHNIREKVDDSYITGHYPDVNADSLDMIEGGDYAEAGDFTAYNSLWTMVKAGLTDQTSFNKFADIFDVENFTDYMAAEIYCRNTSLAHNTMTWKPQGTGKWRWVLMDADRGFFGYGSDLIDYYANVKDWPLSYMLKNTAYKTYFGQRLANQLYTTFNPITMVKQIDQHQADIEPVIAQHVARWLGTTSSYGDAMPSVSYWYDEVEKLRCFANGRPAVVLQDLTNYGQQTPAMLSLSATPVNACTWTFNQMSVPQTYWYGQYPKNMPITLTANTRAGYNFLGWRENGFTELISKSATWSYLDKGTNQGTAWQAASFDDGVWTTGQAPLGYSATGVKTTVSYGSNSSNKYITTYFRRHFNINTPLTDLLSLKANIMRDDGAIVYINGQKALSTNMPVSSDVDYKTTALYACGGLAETTYATYDLPLAALHEGDNVIAVEVHQAAASSSDLIFDLELKAEVAGAAGTYASTDATTQFSLSADRSLTAVFEPKGPSIIPDSINADLTLYKARSPYLAQSDVYVKKGAHLTIEPGVEVYVAPKATFYIHGSVNAQGLSTDSIFFLPLSDYKRSTHDPSLKTSAPWGALCFIHASDTTRMSFLELRGASQGPAAYNCVAAISAFDAVMRLSHLRIVNTNSNPICARYSDVKVSDSQIHSDVLGDLINIKYGKGEVRNCTFVGNGYPDTDGIDFDGVDSGIIHNVTITGFEGSNSDAVDLGERSRNIRIDSLMVYDITDKGVSVGQRSNAFLSHSTIVKTNLGVGVKDSSNIDVSRCTFYAVSTPIACYEKVFGRAGGNATVSGTILSNSYDQTVLCDQKSQVYVSGSLSDNDTLPAGHNNLWGNPGFRAPGLSDFNLLKSYSPAIGSDYFPLTPEPEPVIAEICYNTGTVTDRTEYLRILNPTSDYMDISNYALSQAVEFTFPDGTILPPNGSVYLAKNKSLLRLDDTEAMLFDWTKGNLANEGESVRLTDEKGSVADQVVYSPNAPWPLADADNMVLYLTDQTADNHMPTYWRTKGYPTWVNALTSLDRILSVDHVRGTVTVLLNADGTLRPMQVRSASGQTLLNTNVSGGQTINLSRYRGNLLLITVGGTTQKVRL